MYRRTLLDDLIAGPAGCLGPLLVLLPAVLFLATLSRAAGRVAAENRRLEPGQVWLNLIPLFNLVWLPITIDRLADSLRAELRDRGKDAGGGTHGRAAGLAWLLCWVVAFWLLAVSRQPLPLGFAAAAAGAVCGVSYWAQVAGLARRLKSREYVPPTDEGW